MTYDVGGAADTDRACGAFARGAEGNALDEDEDAPSWAAVLADRSMKRLNSYFAMTKGSGMILSM